ncbi:nucleotidyl transferase [Xanthomonas phage Xoo-sp13]|nr:nucleotidyl transferase [Xanthomonas phage Xoo-sp13]
MSVIKKLYKNGNMQIGQTWATDTSYEVIMGSIAYGVAVDNSDMDIHAITVPPKEMVFPHLANHIHGFGKAPESFEVFQQHNIQVEQTNYDLAIYSIVKFFNLAMENNPNILDMLWVPENCVTHMDAVGKHIRLNRKNFLHKGAYHRFRGYAYQQLKRLENSNRKELIEKYGYDTKFAYHIVRLALQCEQILTHGDMDFSINAPFIKEIRNGALTLDELRDWYKRKEEDLDKLYASSNLQYSPNEQFIKEILLGCLEIKYGSLADVYQGIDSDAFRKLEQIRQILKP